MTDSLIWALSGVAFVYAITGVINGKASVKPILRGCTTYEVVMMVLSMNVQLRVLLIVYEKNATREREETAK